MCLTPSSKTNSNEFSSMENGLVILLNTYTSHPNSALAKTISFYLNKLLAHEDINFYSDKQCDYLNMQRFWCWHAMKKET